MCTFNNVEVFIADLHWESLKWRLYYNFYPSLIHWLAHLNELDFKQCKRHSILVSLPLIFRYGDTVKIPLVLSSLSPPRLFCTRPRYGIWSQAAHKRQTAIVEACVHAPETGCKRTRCMRYQYGKSPTNQSKMASQLKDNNIGKAGACYAAQPLFTMLQWMYLTMHKSSRVDPWTTDGRCLGQWGYHSPSPSPKACAQTAQNASHRPREKHYFLSTRS